jgi:LmbE family N-acetylglucosaminyl deacetylase
MLNVKFNRKKDRQCKVLLLGAHCDDIEIGCGGTILKLPKQWKNVSVKWVVFSSDSDRKREAIASAKSFLKSVKKKDISVEDFRNGFFPYQGKEIKEYFEQMKLEYSPDLIFTHFRSDLHQDHRLINELTWNTYRDNLILEYEIPKYDGDIGSPNFFVQIERNTCNEKIRKIVKYFKSQSNKQWFTEDTFWSIMRLRGIEANSASRYAEAFHCRKICL